MTHGRDTHASLEPLPIAIALEGGGAMDAFSWGALEALLDDPMIRIVAASGTSGGALNAALLVQGLASEGPAEAKRLLEALWDQVARDIGEPRGALGDVVYETKIAMAPFTDAMRAMAEANKAVMAAMIPGLGPSPSHPLRGIVTDLLRPEVFARETCPRLVIAATSVRTGDTTLFWGADVNVEALLASSCLPSKFAAIAIDGESYWDGCYTCNPPLLPLIQSEASRDIVIVRVAPQERPKIPFSEGDVQKRVTEIAFGSALKNDLRSIALHQEIPAHVEGLPRSVTALRDARLHFITAEEDFRLMNGGSVQDPSWSFLARMRDIGRRSAARWLAQHRDAVGSQGSLDPKVLSDA